MDRVVMKSTAPWGLKRLDMAQNDQTTTTYSNNNNNNKIDVAAMDSKEKITLCYYLYSPKKALIPLQLD